MTVIVPCSMPVGTALKPAASARSDRLVRQVGRGDIDVGDRLFQQRVANRAAGDARVSSPRRKNRQQLLQRGSPSHAALSGDGYAAQE